MGLFGELTLGGNSNVNIAISLDLIIRLRRLLLQDEHQHLRLGVHFVTSFLVELKDISSHGFLGIGIHDGGVFGLNDATMLVIRGDEDADKVFNCVLIAESRMTKDHHTPAFDGIRDLDEFLATKVPFSITGSEDRFGRPKTVSNLGHRHDAASGLS